MNRNDVIMWVGRILTFVFTYAVFADLQSDAAMSREIRTVVLAIVSLVVLSIFAWQVYIAQKYDGMPVIPLSFRWVVATWFGSMLTFITWLGLTTIFDEMYTDLHSAVVWWQFGISTIWFASRWARVQTPHQAGIGETGASPNGHGG